MFKSYFSAKHVLDKGALFNYVLSDRSDGKTFDCKVRALYDFKNNGTISIYMRRFKTELTASVYENFFDSVLGDLKPEKEKYRQDFKDWEFRGFKRGVQAKKPMSDKWEWIVFFIPLTMSGKMKSQLDSYVEKIETINFDEYVPLDNRYAVNEMRLLMEFWKSVDRDREIVQLIVLGNRISPFTPFFDFFDLHLEITQDKIRIYREGTLAVQIYSNKEHRQVREKGRFAKLVKDTEYDDYNSGGILETLQLKVASHVGSKYFSSFKTKLGEGSIWTNGKEFIISQTKRKDGFVLCDRMYNTGREEFMITYARFATNFKQIYRTGRMYFEDEGAYHLFEDILKKIW